MFEKEAEEYADKKICQEYTDGCMGFYKCKEDCERYHNTQKYWQDGAEFGYNKAFVEADKNLKAVVADFNKAKEDVKHDLMMKLKDEGIVKPLKDSILRNERLSSQEQQELCAWIECAMDFGENLDECSEKLEYAKTIVQDILNNSDEYARQRAMDFLEEE